MFENMDTSLTKYSEEEIEMLIEMSEMIDEMSEEEINDFMALVEKVGAAKKQGAAVFNDNSEYYH